MLAILALDKSVEHPLVHGSGRAAAGWARLVPCTEAPRGCVEPMFSIS
jgi:hypothetical protein